MIYFYAKKDINVNVRHFYKLNILYSLTVKSNGYNEGFSTKNDTQGVT